MSVREWLTREETARRLNRSPRTLEKWMRDGRLKWKTGVPEGGGTPQRLIHAGEVEKHVQAQEFDQQHAQELAQLKAEDVSKQRKALEPENSLERRYADIDRRYDERMAEINRRADENIRKAHEQTVKVIETLSKTVNPTPWLTLEEAAVFSGLSVAYLKTMIELLKIRAIRGGSRKTWRVQRASLEKYAG